MSVPKEAPGRGRDESACRSRLVVRSSENKDRLAHRDDLRRAVLEDCRDNTPVASPDRARRDACPAPPILVPILSFLTGRLIHN